jgi:hypothetical protein
MMVTDRSVARDWREDMNPFLYTQFNMHARAHVQATFSGKCLC